MPSKQPNSFSLAVSTYFATNLGHLDRVTTTLQNDADDPVLCTLRETNTGLQGKIMAGAGIGLALSGLATT